MGVSFSSLFSKLTGLFSRQSEIRILLLGLDSAYVYLACLCQPQTVLALPLERSASSRNTRYVSRPSASPLHSPCRQTLRLAEMVSTAILICVDTLRLLCRGKTTILYRLQIGEVVTTIPTIGFNVESVQYKNIKFQVRLVMTMLPWLCRADAATPQVWDLGGQTSIRPYWRCYYADTKAVIYVVDSADRERLGTNKAELLAMLSEDELADAKLLVFANKQVRRRQLPSQQQHEAHCGL